MNEVMQVRAASWTAMIKQRSDSGLTIKEWCAANGIQESVYYYRLNRLRKMALNACETPDLQRIMILLAHLRRYQLLLLYRLQMQQSAFAVVILLWK